jgi:predicted ATPase/DNA-binding CsgD family transcriptional regulator
VSSFVNRRSELAALRRLLSAARLVTLTGTAGVGKTRLALAAGADAYRAFPDGVWLVELAHVRDEALVAHAVAHALRIHDLAGDPLGALVEFLRSRSLLLVLDNCEHLVDGCTVLIDTVLRAAADVRVVATSREVLRQSGEHEFRLAPLAVVPADGRPAAAVHAVELFAQRARAATPDFRLDDGNRADVEDVCRRLEGIPLAIELAAARLRVLSVRQLRTRLDDRFRLLTSGPRTLRMAVDWSYELCDEAGRRLWQRASAFGGEFDLQAVEEIYAALGDEDAAGTGAVLDALDDLVAKSIFIAECHDGRVWYRMLETLREYGRQRLRDSGEETRVSRAYAQRYLSLAGRAEREWFGPRQVEWRRLLDREHANIRVAIQLLLDAQATEDALRLVSAIWAHWLFSGWIAEGRVWLSRALTAYPHPTRVRAQALYVGALLAGNEGDLPAVEPLAREAREIAEQLGDHVVAAQALTRLAALPNYRGEAAMARSLIPETLARFAAAGATDSPHAVLARNLLGIAHLLDGDLEEAIRICHESMTICQAAGDTTLLTFTLVHLARAEWLAGELSAAEHVRTSVRLQSIAPIPSLFAHAVELLAWITADEGGTAALRRAAVVLGAADRLWRDSGLTSLKRVPYFEDAHQRCAMKIRAGLGDAAFQLAFVRGTDMPATEIHAFVTGNATAGQPSPPDDAEPPTRLTTREQEVASLIMAGLSNRQIAGKLYVSPRTAESHVQNILTKLGFTSRAQVAAYMATNQPPSRPRHPAGGEPQAI